MGEMEEKLAINGRSVVFCILQAGAIPVFADIDRDIQHNQYEYVRSIVEGISNLPGLYDGYKVQDIMEAAYISAKRKSWVNLSE